MSNNRDVHMRTILSLKGEEKIRKREMRWKG